MFNNKHHYNIEERIAYSLDHSKKHKHNYTMSQMYLGDAFLRFLHQFKDDVTPMIEIIKVYTFDSELQARFKEIADKYDLNNMNENNRLLLIKSIYMDRLHLFKKN